MIRIFRCLILIIGCSVLSLLPAVSPLGAKYTQAATSPLFVGLGDGETGDIFFYTPLGFKKLSTYGFNLKPILSPDGKYIVYGSYAKTYLEDPGRSGAPSTNIWLMETATGNAKRIAEQPVDNRAAGDDRVRPFIARSTPVWSPDSKLIAWLEDAEGTKDGHDDQNDHLIIYSLASGKSTEIYLQPIYGAGCPCSDLTWTERGISVIYAENPGGPFSLRLLDTTGKISQQIPFDKFLDFTWLDGEPSATLITRDKLIEFPAATDTTSSKALPPLEIYSVTAPDGIRFQSESGYFDAEWSLVVPSAKPLPIGKINEFAISPDGAMAAYIVSKDGSLYIFDGKANNPMDLRAVTVRNLETVKAFGLVWSPLAVRIKTQP